MVAPDIDELIAYFDHIYMSPTKSTTTLLAALEPIFEILKPLAPLKKNREVKEIWIRIPRGNIEDFGSFEEMRSCGQIETYEEYVQLWNREYPNEFCWYQLTVVRSLDQNGSLRFYGMALGNESIISASLEDRVFKREEYYAEGAAVRLCELIIPAVKDSMNLLLERKYNDFVQKELPYQFRYGVIKRCDIWEAEQESKEETYGGLSEALVQRFIERIRSGVNDAERIGRIKDFTANVFFMACKLGYEAVGKDCNGYTLSDLYMRYADGRDEGLTGKGDGLNEGPGIDPDDPKAWNEWYLHREHYGCGHPWEVLGLMWLHVDYDESGYYFIVSGSHRQFEMVNFYIALSDAGIPVIIGGADELVASFEGKDYVGIVPHHMYTEHCEECFPEEYGEIIDFIYTPWDGPRSLHDMLDFKNDAIKDFVPDYKINLISPADMDDDEFTKFNTDLGFAMNVIKHQSNNADEIIGATNHRKIDRDTAVFLNTAARLHLEYEEKTGGIDMCKALDNRIQKEKIISVMDYMKDEGKSETDIINKIIERFHVTKEYVLALLSPQKA